MSGLDPNPPTGNIEAIAVVIGAATTLLVMGGPKVVEIIKASTEFVKELHGKAMCKLKPKGQDENE